VKGALQLLNTVVWVCVHSTNNNRYTPDPN